MRYYSALAIVFAVAIGMCVIGAVQTSRPAEAFSPSKGVNWADDVMTKEEIFRLKKLWQMPTRPEAARNITTTAARSKLPTLSRGLITRGGLAGLAAGIWIHNGVMLWNAADCGQPSCPEPLVLDVEFRRAAESGGGGFAQKMDADGNVIAAAVVERAEYRYNSTNDTSTFTATYIMQPVGASIGKAGTIKGESSAQVRTGLVDLSSTRPSPQVVSYGNSNMQGLIKLATYGHVMRNGTLTGEYSDMGQPFPNRTDYTWTNPIYDWGVATVVEASPTTTHEFGQQQSTEFANQVGQQGCPTGTVASPEAPTAPEVCPDYFPQEWEEEFEEETEQIPGESPYDDPDQDGEPNKDDQDDDGDEVPDREDDQPYVPLPDSPGGDPDEDGDPNRSDPDDDGDGIPDQDDPQPYVPTEPTELPEDHPYGDPDRDGQPNKDDQDDDGDGRNDEEDDQPVVPFFSPRADPDKDGVPNEDDKNDDNDPAEDWEDDDPWSPNTPNNPDQDTDDDGVPDWSDPWPGNPYAPADPGRDNDQDGVPDFKDPEPDRRYVPWYDPEDEPDDPTQDPDGDPDSPGSGDRWLSPPNYPDTPWNPTEPPWQNPTPGTPNVPKVPSNPNVPNTPNTPDMPGDPSTGTSNPPPTRKDVPDDPNTQESPDEPPPPSGPLFVCPAPLRPVFVLPPVDFEEKFPFSLILGAKEVLGQLIATPKAPVFDLPMLGTQDLSRFDGVMGMMRTVWLVILGGILMPIMFYRLIKGGGES